MSCYGYDNNLKAIALAVCIATFVLPREFVVCVFTVCRRLILRTERTSAFHILDKAGAKGVGASGVCNL